MKKKTNKTLLSGKVVSGFGVGKYYLSFVEYKKQIQEIFGFEPYEGTLNIELSPRETTRKIQFLKNSKPILIKGFVKDKRTFGDLFAYPCKIKEIICVIIVPSYTQHPPNILEVIAPVNLKNIVDKKLGDTINISNI